MNCVVHGILPVEESVVQAGSCTYSRVYIPVYDRLDTIAGWLSFRQNMGSWSVRFVRIGEIKLRDKNVCDW